MKNVISVGALAAQMSDTNVVILDCSVDIAPDEAGGIAYLSGIDLFRDTHIPGARHADLVSALSDTKSPYIFALPDPDTFRDVMARLGVGDDKLVVLYDRSFTAWAARVWWMLRWIGFDNAVILDGGFEAWKATQETSHGDPGPAEIGTLSLDLRPEAIVEEQQVRSAVDQDNIALIDTLDADSFAGATDSYARPGHICSAQNFFTLSHFKDGYFKPETELAGMLDLDQEARVITYCGAGILASASAFILVQLGYKDVALYAASLQEWAANPDNPMDISG